MKIRKDKGKKTYTEKQIAEALTILSMNNFNLVKTERETGVSRMTLRKWRDSDEYVCRKMRELHRPNQTSAIVSEQVAEEVTTPLKITVEQIKEKAKTVIINGLERLEYLMATEKDITKVAYTLKIISEIAGDELPSMPKGNFFWNVNQMLINSRNEGKFSGKRDKQEQPDE